MTARTLHYYLFASLAAGCLAGWLCSCSCSGKKNPDGEAVRQQEAPAEKPVRVEKVGGD